MSSGHFSTNKPIAPQTVTPETTLFRFTLEEIQDADHEMFGFCLACREIRECTEPDAENYACEVCGEDAVYGPHWILPADLVT